MASTKTVRLEYVAMAAVCRCTRGSPQSVYRHPRDDIIIAAEPGNV
jgi:hypothetical protein